MEQNIKIEWSALEYEYKDRSADWFWALGVIIITAAAASLIYANYFFAALIILSGILLGFFAIKPPETIFYELNEKGLKVRGRIYLYENIKSFWVQKAGVDEKGGTIKPLFFIKTERPFMPIISVSILDELENEIEDKMLAKEIPQEEMKEHISEKIMDFLGF